MKKIILLSILIMLLTSCSNNATLQNVEQVIQDNDIKCNLLLLDLTLEEDTDKLFICDDYAHHSVHVNFLSYDGDKWLFKKSESMSKDEARTLDWNVRIFKVNKRSVSYSIAWGLIWDDRVESIEIKEHTNTYIANIILSNQDYRLWYYLFSDQDDVDYGVIPSISGIIGYDESKDIVVSIPQNQVQPIQEIGTIG